MPRHGHEWADEVGFLAPSFCGAAVTLTYWWRSYCIRLERRGPIEVRKMATLVLANASTHHAAKRIQVRGGPCCFGSATLGGREVTRVERGAGHGTAAVREFWQVVFFFPCWGEGSSGFACGWVAWSITPTPSVTNRYDSHGTRNVGERAGVCAQAVWGC